MKVFTTSGKQFSIDFETDKGYQQMREMCIHLEGKNFFKEFNTLDEKIEDMVNACQQNEPELSRDVIKMVVKHYYKQLESKKENGEIDDIDIAIQLGKLVLTELKNWK